MVSCVISRIICFKFKYFMLSNVLFEASIVGLRTVRPIDVKCSNCGANQIIRNDNLYY